MKFTLKWLKEHLDTDASLQEITDALTMLGLELESVEDRGAALTAFTIAHVIEAKQHPNADRLRVCMVDVGGETVQVVCGAPNARTGMKGVFAPAGAFIPGTGIELKPGNIRGEASNGMLCSERELMISEDHDGIIDLPEDAPVGARYVDYAGIDDPVIDIAITPNRADCLGVRGVARDLAAAGLGTLKPLDSSPVDGQFDSPINWQIEFADDQQHLCPLVAGRYFRGVTNGPSPKWMQDRLIAVGLRPISALVDITNYVMLDVGRPLHAYDADKVDGDIIIRNAKPGEKYLALNGREYNFDPEMIVIGDQHGPDDLAGIMGGERTGCSDDTTNMFLEVAIFDETNVAATGRKLNVLSDARYRFERGLDQTSPYWGTELATKLVLEICGGTASTVVMAGPGREWQRQIGLRHSRIKALCGVDISEADAKRILGALAFEVSGDGETMQVTPPPWRGDIDGEADLVEEIVRINGFDKIAAVSLSRPHVISRPALSPAQQRVRKARRTLAGRGMVEAVTFSFMPGALAKRFGGGSPALHLVNPISSDLDVMRPSILPNLLSAAAQNLNQSVTEIALFEVGPQYADDTPKGQAIMATGLRIGDTGPRHWSHDARAVDAYDAKADAIALLDELGAPTANLQVSIDAPDWYHPGRSGSLRLGPNVIAWFGEIHPAVLQQLDIKSPAVGFELFIERVPMPKSKRSGHAKAMLSPSPFQPVTRDFAFIVDHDVAAENLLRAAKGADKDLISGVGLFDDYQGKGVGDGKKSLAIWVTLQPKTATLTEDEINSAADRIVAAVAKSCGGELRG